MAFVLVLKNRFNFLVIFFVFFLFFGCVKRDSINSASYSDNRTYKAKKYSKNEPLLPFGNLKNSKEDENKTISYYQNYTNNAYYNLRENEEYILWLASERRKRLASGKLNGFKQESMPGYNDYYIKKTQIVRGKNPLISETYYIDIERQIEKAKKFKEEGKVIEKPDPIEDYKILNNTKNSQEKVPVEKNEYHAPF